MIKLVLKTLETENSNFEYFELYNGNDLITLYSDVRDISVIVCEQTNYMLVSFSNFNTIQSVWVNELENKTNVNISYEKGNI